MASSALEEKINKIRQQNEEIRRRYEEVEEDKKNAAKSNALVQMVPSTDWPERKEPPEFYQPPRPKPKASKEKHEHAPSPHAAEGKKVHTFAQGEGPPPDPKYNFLADSEREEGGMEYQRENTANRQYNKVSRGNFRKKGPGRGEPLQKDNRTYKGNQRDDYQPGYDAWRAERNRIDEDRISRQRTAEGNWRREWDNDKMHIVDDTQKRSTLGDYAKKDYDRRYNVNGSEHAGQNRGGYRPHRGNSKNFHNSYDSRPYNSYEQHKHNPAMSSSNSPEDRTVVATDKSLKVTLNQGNMGKGQVMSVKVNSPSIAGTGRVGPRQRTRLTYSHTDAEMEAEAFTRQPSFDEKSKGAYFNNQKYPNVRRAQSLKKPGSKSPYLPRKETKEGNLAGHRYQENEFGSYQRDGQQKSAGFGPRSPRDSKRSPKRRNDSGTADSGPENQPEQLENAVVDVGDEVQVVGVQDVEVLGIETQVVEAQDVEAQDVEVLGIEAQDVEAPVVEAQDVEAPVVDTHDVEAQVVESQVVEAPVVETQVVEAPVVETQVVETPVVETQVVEAPVVEAPIVEAPVVQTQVVEAPVVETQVVEAPVVKTQVVQAPVIETQVVQAPVIAQRIEVQTVELPKENEHTVEQSIDLPQEPSKSDAAVEEEINEVQYAEIPEEKAKSNPEPPEVLSESQKPADPGTPGERIEVNNAGAESEVATQSQEVPAGAQPAPSSSESPRTVETGTKEETITVDKVDRIEVSSPREPTHEDSTEKSESSSPKPSPVEATQANKVIDDATSTETSEEVRSTPDKVCDKVEGKIAGDEERGSSRSENCSVIEANEEVSVDGAPGPKTIENKEISERVQEENQETSTVEESCETVDEKSTSKGEKQSQVNVQVNVQDSREESNQTKL